VVFEKYGQETECTTALSLFATQRILNLSTYADLWWKHHWDEPKPTELRLNYSNYSLFFLAMDGLG
jgi:hypothetical protein